MYVRACVRLSLSLCVCVYYICLYVVFVFMHVPHDIRCGAITRHTRACTQADPGSKNKAGLNTEAILKKQHGMTFGEAVAAAALRQVRLFVD